ncbi:MAG TPA: dTDP-4-dehydrorhamnose 3,5-epimerase [Gammaproteobacteria bacterium]|nr:dTDP-4-dehydrorhamnose 3,5-epimerase [Gammaproteobacteria bacterium]
MEFHRTEIADVIAVQPRVLGDSRGFFMETWQRRKFAEAGIDVDFVQDNFSRSARGTLRGMHYQIEHAQGKLVYVVAGEVFDVAVDLRRHSKTFGCWVSEYLSAENHRMLWIPPGFAHGFYVLSDSADFVYKCTDFWAPEFERTVRWDDADLAIRWPIPAHTSPLVSDKDAAGCPLRRAEVYR